jgi:flagellum-specific peptidoglycan hydrolase FlgJ
MRILKKASILLILLTVGYFLSVRGLNMGNTIDFSQRGSTGNTIDFSTRSADTSLVEKPQAPVHTGPFESKAAFVSAIQPLAKQLSQELGIDERVIIAQSAVETGWGSKVKGNSFFGIKAHGGEGIDFTTHEVVNGQRVKIQDTFKAYDSLADSVQGYGTFLQENPRYKPFLTATTLEEQIAALGRSGYATDPNYAKTVRSIAKGKTLRELGGYE